MMFVVSTKNISDPICTHSIKTVYQKCHHSVITLSHMDMFSFTKKISVFKYRFTGGSFEILDTTTKMFASAYSLLKASICFKHYYVFCLSLTSHYHNYFKSSKSNI